MKNLVLGVVLSAFILTAVPVHAQVTDPVERARIIALIEVLLKRIEEIKVQMEADKKSVSKEENRLRIQREDAEAKAKAQARDRQEKQNQVNVLADRIIRMESYGMECTLIHSRGDGLIHTPEGKVWTSPSKRDCEIKWASDIADLKIEKRNLEQELNGN